MFWIILAKIWHTWQNLYFKPKSSKRIFPKFFLSPESLCHCVNYEEDKRKKKKKKKTKCWKLASLSLWVARTEARVVWSWESDPALHCGGKEWEKLVACKGQRALEACGIASKPPWSNCTHRNLGPTGRPRSPKAIIEHCLGVDPAHKPVCHKRSCLVWRNIHH